MMVKVLFSFTWCKLLYCVENRKEDSTIQQTASKIKTQEEDLGMGNLLRTVVNWGWFRSLVSWWIRSHLSLSPHDHTAHLSGVVSALEGGWFGSGKNNRRSSSTAPWFLTSPLRSYCTQAPSARKMVSYDDARDYVTSLFIMLKKEPVILFRIEFLVVLVTLLFFAMFLMDFFRRIIHNPFMRAVFSIFDGVSDSIVLYLLGAMQSAPFKNQLFPIWALVLVNFRYSADYISGYGVPDRRGRRFTEWRNVFKLLGSAFLTWTRGSSFTAPLWSVWCLQIVRSFYRFKSHNLAFRSLWHGGSSHLVAEHMHASARYSNSQPAAGPVTMEDYNYLVYGETRRGFKLNKPQYALSARRPKKTWDARCCCFAGESAALTTLDKVWEYCPIHQPHNQDLKDLPLAFALSRLLRCRLEDVTLRGRIFKMNRELIKNIIGGKLGTSDVLRIMELQLAFVHDYFNTRYPMVFWSGRLSLLITLLLSVLTIGAVGWLAVDIRRIYKPPDGELANLVKGFNIDMIITWAFILLMIAKEFWEMVTYLLSDWTSLILVCEYVQRKCKRTRDSVDTRVDRMLLWFSRAKITDKRWHGFIDQYVFMQSYDDRPRFWNFVHNLTTGIIPKKDDGAKLSSAIKIPECVKKAILEKLSTMVEEKQDCSLPKEKQERSLPKDLKALSNSNVTEQLQKYKAYAAPPMGTDIVLPTSSHVILAWHIATSLCEMELATTHGVNLSNPGFPCSLLSWLTSCCCSKPYLMDLGEKKDGILSWFTSCCSSKSNGKLPDERFTNCCSSKSNGKLPDELREPYTIANSLSRYCAYLLVSKPDLTPDSFLVPKIVFQKTVESARDGILKNCDSLESRRIKLKNEADEPIENSEEDVLKQGAALGKELLKLPDGVRWKVLQEVWTELLIHIAPTRNAHAHRKCLSGGEFITHIWALLWHYGIQKSSLWPNGVALANQAAAAPQKDETVQVSADGSTEQIGANVHEPDEIKGTQEHQAGNSRRGLTRMERTESSEIEEGSHDAIVEDRNFRQEWLVKPKMGVRRTS